MLSTTTNLQDKTSNLQNDLQNDLVNINAQLLDIKKNINQNIVNQKELNSLNQRVTSTENSLSQRITNIENKSSFDSLIWPSILQIIIVILTILGTLFVARYTSNSQRNHTRNDTKNVVLYFIEANKSRLFALSIYVEQLRPSPSISVKPLRPSPSILNGHHFTSSIQGCKELIELLEIKHIAQEIISSSKIFDNGISQKIIRYFMDLENISFDINKHLITQFHKDESSSDYFLFKKTEYAELSKYIKEETIRKLIDRIELVRTHLSAILCLSFDILKSLDSESFEDKFINNTEKFKEQIYSVWYGEIFDGKEYPSAEKYWDDFPELKSYLEKKCNRNETQKN
jgi:hypothetical protein